MTDRTRLIEVAFPLKQASLDSVHEKNVRHGHISTLHIWPARRPLAACRAALIATLLPDPGDDEERKKILERLAGKVVKVTKKKKMPSGKVQEIEVEETVGGILHWGRESSPELEWFRQEIKKAYGGRAPRVLDPFAGGGAIPLEAMRLGCEVTASDINPVAWFILKCTLEYPQRLAGQHRPLPKYAVESPEFMEGYFKGTGKLTKKQLERNLQAVQNDMFPPPDVDLAWHVRAWGWWVLQRAKKDLEKYYPVIDGRPTVAYLWARTVTCKNCRATVPLLKTRWLCKKDSKRVLLTMEPNADKTGVVFGVQNDVPVVGGNGAQRREHDKRIGAGTMSRSGGSCPCCGTIMTKEDVQQEGLRERVGALLTAVVVEGPDGKEYRLPTEVEIHLAADAKEECEQIFSEIPFGLPREELTIDAKGNTWCVLYGLDEFQKLFTSRQLLAIGTFLKHARSAREAMQKYSYPREWIEGVGSYIALGIERLISFNCANVRWKIDAEAVVDAFARFAIPILWDYAEAVPVNDYAGAFSLCYERISLPLALALASRFTEAPSVRKQSAVAIDEDEKFDAIVTDPPYYDAIGYSVLMDFFLVWLRRTLQGLSADADIAFREEMGPKWNHQAKDGELIDDASRFDGDKIQSKTSYEDGMFRSFQACHKALTENGRVVVVFANKQPDAWETLVSAIIRAGFVVNGSWPIQTEMSNRTRALASAALSSSVWLVCKKRPETARPGWDNHVLEEMREKIAERLREFWDAGIRGPDFVWAATGPALEAYSRHPVVKKANEAGQVMTVAEFLRHVRRMVVDFVVGRVLSETSERRSGVSPLGSETVEADSGRLEDTRRDVASTLSALDDVTTYYLLHRNDFRMEDAPAGACILYAISCGLSDRALVDQFDILIPSGGQAAEEEEGETAAENGDAEIAEGTGSTVRLKTWRQRDRKTMGFEAAGGRSVPLIDKVHRLMHLWKSGDVVKVDEYLDGRGLRRDALFQQLLQALIEMSSNEERSLLESISNHIRARGVKKDIAQGDLFGSRK